MAAHTAGQAPGRELDDFLIALGQRNRREHGAERSRRDRCLRAGGAEATLTADSRLDRGRVKLSVNLAAKHPKFRRRARCGASVQSPS